MKATARFVAIDIETTGLWPSRGDRIIEIGAVALEAGAVAEEFHSLIRVSKRITLAAQRIHGITNQMLEAQPSSEVAIPAFAEFIKDSILIAHHAKFDIGFLVKEFLRQGMKLMNPYRCTLEMSRVLYPCLPDHKLGTVYRYLFGRFPAGTRRHRALDDARLVSTLWLELAGR